MDNKNLLSNNINRFLKSYLFLCSLLLLLTVFGNLLVRSLAIGGRWDIGNSMAIADRLKDTGVLSYEPTADFLSSAHYFPGNVYISIIANTLTHQFREEFVILAAALFLFAFVLVFTFTFKLSHSSPFLSIFIVAIFLTRHFDVFRFYAGEMHPDLPCAFFAFAAIVVIDHLIKTNTSSSRLFLVTAAVFLLVCSGIFKQTSIFFYMGIAFYFVFNRNYSFRKKFFIGSILAISGLLVLLQILLIPGCFFETVTLFSHQKFVSPGEYMGFITRAVSETRPMIALLFLYYFLLIGKKIVLHSATEKLWFVCAHLWAVANFISAMKTGGNEGNIEAGLWGLVPFSVQGGIWLWYKCQNVLLTAHPAHHKAIKTIFILFFSLIVAGLIIKNVRLAKSSWPSYISRLADQKQLCILLNKYFSEKTVAVESSFYFSYADSTIKKSTDINLCSEYISAGKLSKKNFCDVYQKKQWEVIIIADKCEVFFDSVFSNYEIWNVPQLPKRFHDLIYVRKSFEVFKK